MSKKRNGLERFKNGLDKWISPVRVTEPQDEGSMAWIKYRLDRLEQRQAWLTKMMLALISGLTLVALGPEGKDLLAQILVIFAEVSGVGP